MPVYVDHTHVGRHVTGLERITLELFSPAALAPLEVAPVTARGVGAMVATQTFGLPALLARSPSALLLCPGFPPSPLLRPFAARVIPYVHDLFLLSRRHDLNLRARLYMAAPFRLAVRRYPCFLVNSEETRRQLAAHCRSDAEITLYRPRIRNVFALRPDDRPQRPSRPPCLRFVALGTVEPRKNFVAAARIVRALRAPGVGAATLEIIGRRGWGGDWAELERTPGVILHGYQPGNRVREILDRADAFICTSHDEGLGLPLLEAQHAGLPVIAPDRPVFDEVLGRSGILIDVQDMDLAARQIAQALAQDDWRSAAVALGACNLQRWNALAAADRAAVIELIARLGRERGSPPPNAERADIARQDDIAA